MERITKTLLHFRCPRCGYDWDMLEYEQLGFRWYADEDKGDICKECGGIGIVV